jgi:hypothetical protein
MKNILTYLSLILFIAPVFCIDNTTADSPIDGLKRNPGIDLNIQDVPIFFTGNPLGGLNAFAVIPPVSIQNPEVSKKIEALIEKELGAIGTVIKASSEDMNGFGTGNILNIQIGRVTKWDGGALPISRVTLNIETPVVITKTNLKSLPRVWSINDFIDSPLDLKSEDKALGPIQKLLREFIKNYKFANPNQSQKPIFYVYS